MPIKFHKPDTTPPPATQDRPRVTKTRGFPKFVLGLAVVALAVLAVFFYFKWTRLGVRGRVTAAVAEYVVEGPCRITKVHVALGADVKEGDVLVESVGMDFKSQVPQYEAALDQTKARLAMAERGGDVGVVDLSVRAKRLTDAREGADVSAARLEAASKSEKEYADLATAIEADRAKEIAKARADLATGAEKLKQAQASEKEVATTLDQARVNFERAKRLKPEGAITVADYELAETKFNFASATAEKASSATAEAKTTLAGIEKVLDAVVKKYDAEFAAAKSRLERAKADTDVARAFDKHAKENLKRAEEESTGTTNDPVKMQSEEIEFLRRQIAEAQGRVDYAKALAGTVAYRAPFAGTVCELNKAVGDSADRSERVVAIYDPATVAIEVRVPEDDLDRVRTGLKAHVDIRGTKMSFDAQVTIVNATPARLPGEMKTAPTTPESAYDRYVACRVSVPDNLRKEIRPGMSANVTIYTW